jgi:hypothetical protein
VPFARDAFQLGRSAFAKGDPRSGHKILDGRGYEHLARPSFLGNSRPNMNRDPAHLAAHQIALARMQASAYLKPKVSDHVRDRASAADRPLRPVEPREKAVSGGVELVSVVADELPADQRVVLLEELTPRAVTKLSSLLCRADDVREEHGREHAVGRGGMSAEKKARIRAAMRALGL